LASFTEGTVKYNHSPNGATISLWQRHIGWMSQIFPTPLPFSALDRRDPLLLGVKIARFQKQEKISNNGR